MQSELSLVLSYPVLSLQDNNIERVTAKAQLVYRQGNQLIEESELFSFLAPIGLLEVDELKWYLERYYTWPVGLFKKRAEDIEGRLPEWGKELLASITVGKSTQRVFQQWLRNFSKEERLFTLNVQTENTPKSLIAASRLLGLPWELLHDGEKFLLACQPAVQIRRNILSNHLQLNTKSEVKTEISQIRILVVSPRPSQTEYIDYRASMKPLLEAVQTFGDRLELVRVQPTMTALKKELEQAAVLGKPFHILHFDGHGIFDEKTGKGALCFEHELDNDKLLPEVVKLVYANDLARLLIKHHIPLVFLEACQTAQSDEDPNASVAVALLQAGITSVIAMTHMVLIETARRFVGTFYQQLVSGQSISSSVTTGQKALMQSTDRINIPGAGKLYMQDWFVPVLYQRQDSHLFNCAQLISPDHAENFALGDLPETPKHSFIGRSRELFLLDRLLEKESYVVVCGMGGIGKTTIAIELVRWLVHSQCFDRCAFVSLEEYSHDRAVLDVLGKQLIDNKYSVADYGDDLKQAIHPIQNILEKEACLLLLDNMESLLADSGNVQPLLRLADDLLSSSNKTRLIFTSRESLPAPFNHRACEVRLGELSESDAKELIMRVMAKQGLELRHDDQGNTPKEVNALVNVVRGHARALVLLAQELAMQGVTATTESLHGIMQELEQRYKGDREYSLLASVRLSLGRLSMETQRLLERLSVLHGGGEARVIASILDESIETTIQLCVELVQVGLAEEKDYYYYRFDPALSNYLSLYQHNVDKKYYQERWFDAMLYWVEYLYYQRLEDSQKSTSLAKLGLLDLMAFARQLNHLMQIRKVAPDLVVTKIVYLEQLLIILNYPSALREVNRIRQQATVLLDQWSQAYFDTESLTIESLLNQGELQLAEQKARQLIKRCEQEASKINLATANFLLGRILGINGQADEALSYLQQAQYTFEKLGGDESRMASVSLTEQGDCLRDLGQFEQAISAYQQAIERDEKQGAIRDIAVGKMQIATVHVLRKDYATALQGYQEVINTFQQLDEPGIIAGIWHQIGMIHREQSLFDQAETAYRKSLSIWVNNKQYLDEAASLAELGNLYSEYQGPEQAINYYRKAIDIYKQKEFKEGEERQRCNLAIALIELSHLDEARKEILQAIECSKSLGHIATPWVTWEILYNLELADANLEAASQAWQQAIESFWDYRKNGGENSDSVGQLAVAVLQAIQQCNTVEIERLIEHYFEQEDWQEHKTFLYALQTIIAGNYDSSLVEADNLTYQHVVELKLLLEQLQ